MTYIDNLVGEMVAAVDESNTMIVLTSDHGWSLGQHSEWAKFSNYEEVTRVPLILTSPHLTPSVVSDYVELVDLFPSLVSLSGLTPVAECPDDSRDVRLCTQGRDWSTLVSPGHDTSSLSWRDEAYSQYSRPREGFKNYFKSLNIMTGNNLECKK